MNPVEPQITEGTGNEQELSQRENEMLDRLAILLGEMAISEIEQEQQQ